MSEWAKLPLWQRRLLVASGAGAGFAAVYNVPLGGALLALEVMLGTLALPFVLPALLASLTATAVAWIFLGNHPLYYVAPDPFPCLAAGIRGDHGTDHRAGGNRLGAADHGGQPPQA